MNNQNEQQTVVIIGASAMGRSTLVSNLREDATVFDDLSNHKVFEIRATRYPEATVSIKESTQKGAYRKFAKKSRWQNN